ncbi:MAG: hypothetical protein C5B60_06265 [Chloroflexi bacterium]|nr:MAG: hypothetical protein C5B60_06265 [Chloroflexota bacterium]
MADITMKKSGTWLVELNRPLMHRGKEIAQLEIKPPNWDQQIRLAEQKIVSMLGLLAEMCGLPEQLLREMTYPDVDRVMLAFHSCLPPIMQQEFQQQRHALATPTEQLPEPADVGVSDQDDPRFPKMEGTVKKFEQPPQINFPEKPEKKKDSGTGINIDAPGDMRPVN